MTKKFFIVLVGAILVMGMIFHSIRMAKNKPFWNDEGYDINMLSTTPFSNIIMGKIGQTNNNPLYYVFQKVVIDSKKTFDEKILVHFRAVSVFSAALLVLLLYLYVYKNFSLFFSIFGVLVLFNQRMFFQYAIESRHYMIWLLCVLGLIFSTVKLSKTSFTESSISTKLLFVFCGVLTTLVISMGFIQVAAAVMTCLVSWYFVSPMPQKKVVPLIKFAVPFLAGCVILGLYFSLIKPSIYGSFKGSAWDLLDAMGKGDYSLLKMPIRLLFPKPGRDACFAAWLTNFICLIGFLFPIFLWKKRLGLTGNVRTAFLISLAATAQVCVTFIIGGIVAYFHFYFVQRVFLYLIVCQVLLVLSGAVFVYEIFLKRKLIGNPTGRKFLKISIIMVLTILTGHWNQESYARTEKLEPVRDACRMKADELPNYLQRGGNVLDLHRKLNFIADVGRQSKFCGWIENSHTAVLWHDEKMKWHLSEIIPSSGKALKFGNKNVIVK